MERVGEEDGEKREAAEEKRNWDEGSEEAAGENVDKYEQASGVGCLRSPLVEVSSGRTVSCEQSPGLDEGTVGTASHRCPLVEPGLGHQEVAEHLAHGLWSDLSSPPPSLLQDSLPETGPENIQGSSSTLNPRSMSPKLDWLNQLYLTSSTGDCPFLHGLDRGMDRDAQLPGCEGSSQSEKSPCVSSLTSGDDGDSDCFDTEGDSDSCSY
ncbi:unnamed protein product, partial [Oncorhynchus mykiss]